MLTPSSQPSNLPLTWVNGLLATSVQTSDRGFQYGDGLFETMRVSKGKIPLWLWHWGRLQTGCERLRMPLSESSRDMITIMVDAALAAASERQQHSAIIKLIVTRGEGGRGYRTPANLTPTIVVQLSEFSPASSQPNQQGIQVTVCQQRLSHSPLLAGIKHLNRIEHIMARMEWDEPHIQEGLLLDQQGHLIEGVVSNLFWCRGQQLYTPSLAQAGVNGVMRQYIIDQLAPSASLSVTEVSAPIETLLSADEAFVCNSVQGLWPITQCHGQVMVAGDITQQLQQSVGKLWGC